MRHRAGIGRFALALALCCVGLAAPAQAGTRQQAQVLYSDDPAERAFQERFGYNDAIILPDGTIYLSGVIVAPQPGDANLDAAYARAYRRLGNILVRAGATWEDVVEITSFHTALADQLEPMARVQKQFITPPFAAWTAIQVVGLADDRGITEIKLIARQSAE